MTPDIDFHRLRPYGTPASVANAFEEVVSLLMRDGLVDWPAETTFSRFGNPDGGREGRGVLGNGDVWAWQAKYLFAFDSGEIAQVNKSVLRALDAEPDLKRYYVALPYDLPAGDTNGPHGKQLSAHTKWLSKTKEWAQVAAAKGMDVDFIYLGAHDLTTVLSLDRHAGRAKYWFDATVLSAATMNRRLSDVVAKAGRRYSPRVHVKVPAARSTEAVGRTETFVRRFQDALAGVRTTQHATWSAPQGDETTFARPLEEAKSAIAAVEEQLSAVLDAVRTGRPIGQVADETDTATTRLKVLQRLLRQNHLQDNDYYADQAAALYRTIVSAEEALATARALVEAVETDSARVGRLLIIGRAGAGKTHLLCDAARRRLEAGQPTLLILGQDFDARGLLGQVGELVELPGTLEDVLTVLDAAGEATGCRAALIIDALNEAVNPERWVADMRALTAAVERHPNVVLIVSCRTEFVDKVLGDVSAFPHVEHHGFMDAAGEAIDRYTAEYGLPRLQFPVMNPEYQNPLFLRLACEALSTLGTNRFELGTAGIATVCQAYLEAVNARLAAPGRCDYDESTNLVQVTVTKLADTGPGPYDQQLVRDLTEEALPGAPWSRSLMLGMKREGILSDTHNNQLVFGYQRLGDMARATRLIGRGADGIRSWYEQLATNEWSESGTISALAVLAPDTLGVEIIDLVKDAAGRVGFGVIDAFVDSLVSRTPRHTTERTGCIVEQLLADEGWRDRIYSQLVRVACLPEHHLNAEWTHRLLVSAALPIRDSTWSEWLQGSTEIEDAVRLTLKWAWAHNALSRAPDPMSDDVSRLASLILGWMLTVPDRRVRDRATKALVSVGERNPVGFAAAVPRFNDCDDPWVVERLSAAACAIALRAADAEVVNRIADAAAALVEHQWPVHVVTRDYLRRISEAGRRSGWDGPSWAPPYTSDWPTPAMTLAEIEALDKLNERNYSSIWGSLAGLLGDFGRYEIEPALRNFDHPDHDKLQVLAERSVFTRVLDLGWTPELFKHLDQGRSGGMDGPTERYGKKYQWIGFHEILGRLADNYKLRDEWDDEADPFDYSFLEQLVHRDIDPTVLTPGVLKDADNKPTVTWFAPVLADFPSEINPGYPKDLDGIPDPLDLIALTDTGGRAWLALARYSTWSQQLPPETQALTTATLQAWAHTRSYLVKVDDISEVQRFADGQDWYGRWMPEPADTHSRLLGAHPYPPDWQWDEGPAEARRGGVMSPRPLFHPFGYYSGTGGSLDASGPAELTGFVPSRLLFDLLQLRNDRDFRWHDANGLAVADPAAGTGMGSTFIMRRDLAGALADRGYTLLWTVLLNKQLLDRDHGAVPETWQRMNASAAYVLTAGEVELVSAQAWREGRQVDPVPTPWPTRTRG